MILIIHFGQLYSIFNYGNQFARVQLAQLVNNNATMRNVLSLYLVTLCIFLDWFNVFKNNHLTYQSELL